jgi:hypothetical protein
MTRDYRLDMTTMYAFHDALRRDLAHEPVRQSYQGEWQPAYAATNWWFV